MTNEWTTDGRPMSRIAQRFWGGVGQRILDSGALDGTQYKPGQSADEGARLSEYDRRWAYYQNDALYTRLHRAGLTPSDMPAHFNPIPAVVDFYLATALAGDAQVQAATDDGDGDATGAAVRLLWRGSNWPTLRRDLTVTAAVLGDVFVKVAERQPSPEEGPTAVYMQDIAPQHVRWWDVDERGYLTAIRIDTERLESVFTGEKRRHTLIEIWRKVWPDGEPGGVRFYEVLRADLLNEESLNAAVRVDTFDDLGYDFIPIVWERLDTPWRRQVTPIDRYNALAWQMTRLNRPLAVIRAGGEDKLGRPLPAPPGADDLQELYSEEGDGVMGVVRLPGRVSMEWSGNAIDFGAMTALMAEVKESVIDGLPEYRVATLRGVQVATETLQLLMNQAEARALALRDGLQRALVRAHLMAFTIAQVAGIQPDVFGENVIGWYDDGRAAHEFVDRPVFTKTAAAKATEFATLAPHATAEGAATVAGYDRGEIEALVNLSIAEFPEEAR